MDSFDVVHNDLFIDQLIVESHNQDIKQLENDMLCLSEIMQDLSVMVKDQGEQLDVVAQQTNVACENIVIGEKSLEGAVVLRHYSRLLTGAFICTGVALGGVGLTFIVPVVGAITAGVAATGAATCFSFALAKK